MNINELRLAIVRKFGFATDEVVVVSGIMGLPISFLDKYCPEQFEIVGATESEGKGFSLGLWDETSGVAQPLINGERLYKRFFIHHKQSCESC